MSGVEVVLSDPPRVQVETTPRRQWLGRHTGRGGDRVPVITALSLSGGAMSIDGCETIWGTPDGTGNSVGKGRRALLRQGLTFAGGVAAGLSVDRLLAEVGPDRLPLSGGYASGGVASPSDLQMQNESIARRGATVLRWQVATDQPMVALTFDDGPGPDWTPMVLDTLDRHEASATFFVVGERLTRHEELVRNRLARHELGNHTWAHQDLARLDEDQVRDQILRTHFAIKRVTGESAKVMRPPWAHLGGSSLVIAEEFGYDVVMWSHQMQEDRYAADPPAQARDIIDNVGPGSIVLAHDVGESKRLVALSQLDAIIVGLRRRGLEPVTVSELIAAASELAR